MASFKEFKKIIAPLESGYLSASMAATIGDKGGETYKGVARNHNPNWAGWPIVDAAKAANGGSLPWKYIIPNAELDRLVDNLFKANYWDKISGDAIQNQSIANFMGDWAINSGPGIPSKAMQRILGVTVDGAFGPQSVRALNNAPQKETFDKIKEARRDFISGNSQIADNLEPALIKNRVDSFFFREA